MSLPRLTSPSTSRSVHRGQILVLFGFLLTILIGFSAFVVDVAWVWTNQLKVQRAADAAALAGVVHLPGQITAAKSDAWNESRKNGYRDGVNGVHVNPRQDPDNPRRMVVTVSAPVDTFFMGLFGFDQVTVSRTAKADFILPVPMGSPLNYYGVGDFRTMVAGSPASSGARAPGGMHDPDDWSNANDARFDGGGYANDDDGDRQGYDDFSFGVPSGSTIAGIDVRVDARSTDSDCAIGVQLSWNDGGSWTSQKTQSLSTSFATYHLGGATDSWGHGWSSGELADNEFVVRVADVDTGSRCSNSARTDLDHITVTVHYTGPATEQEREIAAADGNPLCGAATCSQGFWGAIEGQGSNRSTGDAYATGLNGSGPNADYDPQGYDYTIEMPSGGTIYVFDPTFCATTSASIGGHYGTGDHWLADAETVSTYFRLFNTNGSPVKSDHTLVKESGTLFQDEYQADLITGSGSFSDGGEPTNPKNCSEGAITNASEGGYWHNRWWPMASVGAGTYRLQVTTTHPTSANRNQDESFENMWSILADGSDAKIYGSGRMVSYANIANGGQTFYLAQIDRAAGAGKTVEIRLFDPGDVGQKAWMQILSPDGNSYDPVTFDYSADNGRSGTGVTCIQTFGGSGPSAPTGCPNITSGGTFYQNSWITINVPLDADYGASGLLPPGETEEGWWKIRYTVNDGNDTTTWEVSIRGNPVQLVVP